MPRPTRNPEKLNNVRQVEFRDVPAGLVVWHEGFWGVVVRGFSDSRFIGQGLDRWDAPPIRLDDTDIVLVPYASRWGKPLRRAIPLDRVVRPILERIIPA
jgi:hypothetical protein